MASTSAHVERKSCFMQLRNFSSTHHGSALAHASASRPDPWAGSSPRGRRAPLWTLKRLVCLRAATSASPKRHRFFFFFFAGEEGKQREKNGARLFHSRIYWAAGVAVVSWASGSTDRDIYKARGAARRVRPSHSFPGTGYNVAFVRLPPAQQSVPCRSAGPLAVPRRCRRSPAPSTHTTAPATATINQ